MAYESITLSSTFTIEKMISIHYFEYMNDFSFPGETHNFWEFLCVDNGSVRVVAGSSVYILKKGDIIFHKPNEFHNVEAWGNIAPNLIVISFECYSSFMKFFEHKILHIGDIERTLLAQIIKEARLTFLSRLDDPYCEKLIRKEEVPFGSEQLIQMYLQQMLIQLMRKHSQAPLVPLLAKTTKTKNESTLFYKVHSYMEENIDRSITIEQICKDNLIGRSILQKLFQKYTGCGIIDYFSKLKIKKAKQMIRNQHMNFSQIADSLGYSSIHYFSRQFKKITGLTPSQYASSIKALSEKQEKI